MGVFLRNIVKSSFMAAVNVIFIAAKKTIVRREHSDTYMVQMHYNCATLTLITELFIRRNIKKYI